MHEGYVLVSSTQLTLERQDKFKILVGQITISDVGFKIVFI